MGHGAPKSRIIKAFKNARKNYDRAMVAHLIDVAVTYAKQALIDAVDNYLESSGMEFQLTGNTIAGFTAGVFNGGKLIKLINVLDVYPGLKRPTASYAQPGNTGFQDYGSGERIHPDNTWPRPKHVYEYDDDSLSFQPLGSGTNSIDDTARFLNQTRLSWYGKSDVVVMVANFTPYVEFLVEARDFDILQTLSFNIRNDLIAAFKATRFDVGKHFPDKDQKSDENTVEIAEVTDAGSFRDVAKDLGIKLFDEWMKTGKKSGT